MVKINMNELTKEQIQKAMACETAEELMAAAKAEGYELTKDEAEAYLTECYTECNSERYHCHSKQSQS